MNPLYYEDSDEQIRPEQYATDYETDVELRYIENRDGPYSLSSCIHRLTIPTSNYPSAGVVK